MGWAIAVIVLILVVGYFLFMGPYNSLVKLRNTVQEAWQQIDVELNRRYDLIPNLVETVKGYAGHEQKTLEGIVALRNQARAAASQGSGVPSEERAALEGQLTGAVTQFFALAESYPELKANENFRDLQRQLIDTEDRISNGRRYYNAVVSNYNTKIEAFPSNIAAGMFKFERAGYFEIKDPMLRSTPQVSFDDNMLPPTSRSSVQDERPALEDRPDVEAPFGDLPGTQGGKADLQFEARPGQDGQSRMGG